MQRVTDQVDIVFLKQPAPRSLPFVVILNLMGDYVFERPLRTLFNPLLIVSLSVLVLIVGMGVNRQWLFIPLVVMLVQLIIGVVRMWQRVSDSLALLRRGLIVRAHVLKLRPHRGTTGEINGALIDCAIPVAPRRTYVGSIWIADGNEALRLAHQRRIDVVCLPRTPGTWRIIEDIKSEVRYDPIGTTPDIPQD